jgi:hypothetical protein
MAPIRFKDEPSEVDEEEECSGSDYETGEITTSSPKPTVANSFANFLKSKTIQQKLNIGGNRVSRATAEASDGLRGGLTPKLKSKTSNEPKASQSSHLKHNYC